MSEYIECRDCGFVLLSDGSAEPKPKGRHDTCPNCGHTNFRFTSE